MDAWYAAPEHAPYDQRHQPSSETGALLIHGFTGSPYDMRSVADVLFDCGIDVHVMSLPGMARDVMRLNETTATDWRAAVRHEWSRVRSMYPRTMLVGHSLGGALAVVTAAESPPDHLVLFAPFSRIATRWARLLPIAKMTPFSVYRYKNLDFEDERIHDWYAYMRPGLDTYDPETQRLFREEAVYSLRMLASMNSLSGVVRQKISTVTCPTLLFQGVDDTIVLRHDTRTLVSRIGGEVTYHEFRGDHYIPIRGFPGWDRIESTLRWEFGQNRTASATDSAEPQIA